MNRLPAKTKGPIRVHSSDQAIVDRRGDLKEQGVVMSFTNVKKLR